VNNQSQVSTWHCPGCGVELKATGSVEIEGSTLPVFQCDKCVTRKPVFGEMFDVALTFAVNAAGQPIDVADDELL
jgi:hypothetical protein